MTFREYLKTKGYTEVGCEAVDMRIRQNTSTYEDRSLYQQYLVALDKAKSDNKGASKGTARAAGKEPESIVIKDYETFKNCILKSCEQDGLKAAERDYKYERALGELVCRDRHLYYEYEEKLRKEHKNDRARLSLDLDVNTTEGG